MKRVTGTILLTMVIAGCHRAGQGSIDSQPDVTLRADSAEYRVRVNGPFYETEIGFEARNNGRRPVSMSQCIHPAPPSLEKQQPNGEWRYAYSPVILTCLTLPPFRIPGRASYRGTLKMVAGRPGTKIFPLFGTDSVPGIYRLRWDLHAGEDPDDRKVPTVIATSPPFRLFGPDPSRAPRQTAAGEPQRDSLVIESRILHERRLINVQTPRVYGDPTQRTRRFAVLYMPDGGLDEDFPHVTRAVDSLTAMGVIPPTIVVGIPNTERRRDLTGATSVTSDSAIAPRVGGSASFRAFIRDELIPAVNARYRTTDDRAIIGESLAGLFIVETLLREPFLFNRYAALDPSLWWNRGALVDSARSMLRATTLSAKPSRVFMACSRDCIDERSTRFARELEGEAAEGMRVRFERHSELTHANIFSALEGAALVFILTAF